MPARLAVRYARRLATALVILGLTGPGAAQAQTTQNTKYSYAYYPGGNVLTVTDPRGQVTEYEYDVHGRLSLTTRPAPAAGVAQPVITTERDYSGQLTSLTDPRALKTTATVNGFGETAMLRSPDTGLSSHTFDNGGNRITSTDARSSKTTSSYDALNRLTKQEFAAWTANVFEYDGGSGAVSGGQSTGHLTRMSDESGDTVYAYGAFGRLSSKTQTATTWNGSLKRTVSYTYGSSGVETGKIKTMTYPSGNRLVYSYDTAGRLEGIALNPANTNGVGTNTAISTPLLKTIAYSATGRVRSWAWGNSTDAKPRGNSRDFDLDGRMRSYQIGDPKTSGFLRTLTYDAASRITAITDTGTNTPTRTQSLGYDNLNRLVSAIGTSTYRYGYDANDNRTQLTVGVTPYTLAISPASNRLTGTTGPTPAKVNTYDDAGNLTTDGTIKYVYSPRGRLITVTNGATVVSYRYNAIGQRVEKSNGYVYMYDEAGHLIGEYYNKTPGTMLREIVYLGDEPVALLTQTVTGTAPTQVFNPNVFYIHSDHLGTPRMITQSSDGAVRWQWDAGEPFGMQPPNDNPWGLGTLTFYLRMPGQYFDRESNLFYNYFRDYDPQTGRYVQSDPIGTDGGINTYSYVAGNPLGRKDAVGLCPMCVPLFIEAAEFGITAYRAYKMAQVAGKIANAMASSTGPKVAENCDPGTNNDGPQIEEGKQGKHVPGHNNFQDGKSELTHPDPQSLVDNHRGTGQQVGNTPIGEPGSRERVDFGTNIGNYVDPVTGAKSTTTNGIIHESSKGVHIVPSRPNP